MGLKRGDAGKFFRPTAEHVGILAERRRWLVEAPHTYAGLLPGGGALVDEATALFHEWGILAREVGSPLATELSPWERLLHLGASLEPDLLLLSPNEAGPMLLRAGCICFPSSWRPAEKFGLPMSAIHAPAPGLNPSLGAQIDTFLARLQPGVGWLRSNWGLSASAERNQHSDRDLARLTPDLDLDRVWLRVERQCLVALPVNRGVLFGIRIEMRRLKELQLESAEIARRLAHALRTMPEEIADYKGLSLAREALAARLNSVHRGA